MTGEPRADFNEPDLRNELAREITVDWGRERVDEVDGAPDTRREIAGEGGAGRLENRSGLIDADARRLLVLNAGLTGPFAPARVSGMMISVASVPGSSGGKGVVKTVGVVDEEVDCSGKGDRGGSRCCVLDGVGVIGETSVGDKGIGSVDDSLEPLTPFREDRWDLGNSAASPLPGSASREGVGFDMCAALDFLPFRADGGGFTANSCAPGVGGGRKEDDGEGNGDADTSPSRAIDSRDAGDKMRRNQ